MCFSLETTLEKLPKCGGTPCSECGKCSDWRRVGGLWQRRAGATCICTMFAGVSFSTARKDPGITVGTRSNTKIPVGGVCWPSDDEDDLGHLDIFLCSCT
ncbi:unnamed protein product [Adineta steineri]|uniref:Uncharacterized protein n=1 Tax=Adineta steineri TaxID=433720 RepID=A0A814NFV5_9BILA|nr:unnamed protein product [Adineta steineri]CAF4087114.1 unnamed protein product [Adineta steineri]